MPGLVPGLISGPILGAPLRTGPAHVVQFGPVGIEGDPNQRLPPCHDSVEPPVNQHGGLSVHFAEDAAEGQGEYLFAEVVRDMHDPVPPIFSA